LVVERFASMNGIEDEKWMRYAESLRGLSSCKRRQHGAAIVSSCGARTVFGTNHSLDFRECVECIREKENIPSGTCYEKCMSIHAEQDALATAARRGMRTEGGTLYITGCPCVACARMIFQAGIKRVVIGMREPHAIKETLTLFSDYDIEVRHMWYEAHPKGASAFSEACAECSQTGGVCERERCPDWPKEGAE